MHPQHGRIPALLVDGERHLAGCPAPRAAGTMIRRRSPQAAIALAASACDSRPGEPVADRVHGPLVSRTADRSLTRR